MQKICQDGWIKCFLKRHQNLSVRLCQNIKRARSSVTVQSINEYFNKLENELKDIKPENLINYDETNLTDDPGQIRLVVRRGTKPPSRVIMTFQKAQHLLCFQ